MVEEDKPRWGRRRKAGMTMEQSQTLGFLGRDQNIGKHLQMGHQSKF